MIGVLPRLRKLYESFSSDCSHPMWGSIDESGDGSIIEWECVLCDEIRVERREV